MAFFDDMRPSREPFLNAPAIIFWMIGAIVAAHVARVMAPPPWPEFLLFEFSFIPARFSESAIAASGMRVPNLAGQLIPFVSYMFLHGDYSHLAINSLWLLAFGPIVAKRLGTGKFLLFFLFCGVISAVAHLAVYFGAVEQVVGASGAIAGLMGAAIRIFYGRLLFARNLPPGDTVPIAPLFSRPIIVFTSIWMIANFVAGATGLGLATPGASIAWVAHVGGYFAGLLAIAAFDRVPSGASAQRHRA
jgi:membrane associated rhomboid family serine protease